MDSSKRKVQDGDEESTEKKKGTKVKATPVAAVTANSSASRDQVQMVKYISFKNRSSPIVLQSVEGPCPLIAICNILLLKNELSLDDISEVSRSFKDDISEVSLNQLESLVKQQLLKHRHNIRADLFENMMTDISTLRSGIFVDLKLNGKFILSQSLKLLFVLLHIDLYHGFIIDPEDQKISSYIKSEDSYDGICDKIVGLPNEDNMSKKNTILFHPSCPFRKFLMSDGADHDSAARYLLKESKYFKSKPASLTRSIEKAVVDDRPGRFSRYLMACKQLDKSAKGPYENHNTSSRVANTARKILEALVDTDKHSNDLKECIKRLTIVEKIFNE